MNIYTCKFYNGCDPQPEAAVIRASSEEEAFDLFKAAAKEQDLDYIGPLSFVLFPDNDKAKPVRFITE